MSAARLDLVKFGFDATIPHVEHALEHLSTRDLCRLLLLCGQVHEAALRGDGKRVNDLLDKIQLSTSG